MRVPGFLLSSTLLAASASAAVPGLVELVANRPPTVVPPAPPSVTGFIALRGAGVPALAPEEIDTRKPLAVAAAFACRTTDRVRVTATVDWGDGATGPAAVTLDPGAPAWLAVPPTVATVPSTNAQYGKAAATHEYAAAELYNVRVTFTLTREGDGAAATFVRLHRLRVRDPALANQPWRFDLDIIRLRCNEGTSCDFPLPLATRINTEADYRFGVSWLATHTARWDWGDGTSEDGVASSRAGVGRASGTHVFAKGGRYKVKLTLNARHKDGTPESRTQPFDMIVSDMAIDDLGGPPGAVSTGVPVEFHAAYRFTDPKRKRKAVWSWGDGKQSPGELSERNGQGTVHAEHTFTRAGVIKVKLALSDGETEIGGSVELTVSSPGSVNATGTLPFAAGVLVVDPKASGQAQLSLNARHDGTSPSGGFRLSGPGFELQSEQIETLAIGKTEAHATGTATFNGQRPYSFSVDVWTSPAAEGRPEMHMARVRVQDLARQRPIFDNDVFDGALQPLTGARLQFTAQ
jgi:hypothetical protein